MAGTQTTAGSKQSTVRSGITRKGESMSAGQRAGCSPRANSVFRRPIGGVRKRGRALSQGQQGIIMLVVLVLLALFTMMLITFVIATVNNRQGMISAARVEQTGDPPTTQLHDAFMQLIVGSRNPNSVIGPHSLLEDMYGSWQSQFSRGQIHLDQNAASPYTPQTSGYVYYVTDVSANKTYVPFLPYSGAPSYTGNGSQQPAASYTHTPLIGFRCFNTAAFRDFKPMYDVDTAYGFYNGCVITMLDGPAAGRSSRIVGYFYDMSVPSTPVSYFQTLSFDGIAPNSGDHFLINGRPFSGTGFGFRPTAFQSGVANHGYTRLLDAVDPTTTAYNSNYDPSSPLSTGTGGVFTAGIGLQYALLPNPRRGVFTPITVQMGGGVLLNAYLDPAGPGGANEDYDAPDFQNMLLAMRVWSPSTGTLVTPLPSLHRPDLIYYWNKRWQTQPIGPNSNPLFNDATSSAGPNNPTNFNVARSLVRKITLRPLTFLDDPTTPVDESENPNFTGSNPSATAANLGNVLFGGPWDVDNDGDGVPDSIWVDLGLPVQTSADGRRYKPLVAALVIDMDGKLNLNAHSNWRHTAPQKQPPLPPPPPPPPTRFDPVSAPFAQANPSIANPYYPKVGSGYGPAEISLSPVFEPHGLYVSGNYVFDTADATGATDLARLFGGDTINTIDGRYGEVEISQSAGLLRAPGPGLTKVDDPVGWLRELDYPAIVSIGSPNNYPHADSLNLPTTASFGPFTVNGSWTPSAFGSPNDLDGDGMIALDLRGQPLYIDYPSLTTSGTAGFAAWGEHDDTVDDPYELDLSLNAQEGGYSGTPRYTNFSSNQLFFASQTSNVVSIDAPFTAAELERILRYNDADASALPDRLTRLAPTTLTNNPAPIISDRTTSVTRPTPATVGRWPFYPEIAQISNLLTTHQFDLPSPSMLFASPDLATELNQYRFGGGIPPMLNSHISQLVAARIRRDMSNNSYRADLAITQLISPDLLGGEKMNLNRPLGNGHDDNGNFAVDEPEEAGVEAAWAPLYGAPGVPLDLNNDGQFDQYLPNNPASPVTGITADDGKARQLLARNLYVLLMLLKDDNFIVNADLDGDGYPTPGATITPATINTPEWQKQQRDVAYYLAQWAVNVVDFRDQDSTMTAFEFDIYPFRDDDDPTNANTPAELTARTSPGVTWDVDGIISPLSNPTLSVDDKYYTAQVVNNGAFGVPFRGLVWGCERPELLITETLATHDRRTRNTAPFTDYGATPNPDPDFDQIRRPQGSLVIELFNPNPQAVVGNKIGGVPPNELYAQAGTGPNGERLWGVDLTRRAPAAAGISRAVAGAPVWRLATASRLAAQNMVSASLPPRQPVLPYPNTAPTFPYKPNTTVIPAGTPVIDRVAYLVPQPAGGPTAIPGADTTPPSLDVQTWQQFYAQTGTTAIVPPNRYAVVAPAAMDPYLPSGSPNGMAALLGGRRRDRDQPDGVTYPPTSIKNRYYRRLLATPTFSVFDDPNGAAFQQWQSPGDLKPAIGIPMASNCYGNAGGFNNSNQLATPAIGFNNTGPKTIYYTARFSLTEPSRGYPVATAQQLGSIPDYDENGYYASAITTPFDNSPAPYFTSADPNDPQRQLDIVGGSGGNSRADQTFPQPYTIVYLQRLANPNQAWDANVNPYIVVDQMWVDLTTYNGEKADPPVPGGKSITINNEFQTLTSTFFNFDTRQRSPLNTSSKPPTGPVSPTQWQLTFNNIYYPFGTPPYLGNIVEGSGTAALHNSTLGFLNANYGYPQSNTVTYTDPQTNQTVNMSGLAPYWKTSSNPQVPVTINGVANVPAAEYYGDPTIPFPWLTWNDRPYVSSKELMLVPVGSPSSVLSETTTSEWEMLKTVPNLITTPYEPTVTLPLADGLPKGEFGHLPNVFHSPKYTPPAGTRTQPSPNLYRLMEYVQVPSRFTGTEDWLPPASMLGNTTLANGLPTHSLHPPFNRVSRFRDPGRVNINTIFDPFVWQGIIDDGNPYSFNSPPWLWLWRLIYTSRQGFGDPSGVGAGYPLDAYGHPLPLASLLSSNVPSLFSAPFRSYGGRSLVPLDVMRRPTASGAAEREIDATFLRPTSDLAQGANVYPLLEYPGLIFNSSNLLWLENGAAKMPIKYNYNLQTGNTFTSNAQVCADDPMQNPYFAYRAFRRLDNLLTSRSNVYAIWLTIGYFEVTPAPSNDPQRNAKYPDGWVLGQEIGSDTGDIQRHRAFYMYDRTIPVGFERGETHNAYKGVLLERFIE